VKIKLAKNKDLVREYHVTCDENLISIEYKNVLDQASKEIKVDGFKKGAVPLEIVEQKMSARVLEIAASSVQKKVLSKILEDEKLEDKIAHVENVTPIEPYTKSSMKMSVVIQMHPEMPSLKLEKIKIERPVCEIDKAFAQERIEQIAKNYSQSREISENRPIKNGDIAKIDFVGKINGVPFDGGTGGDYDLEIGSGNFIPGFEEQLIGANIGDTVIVKVPFPADYHVKDLAGQASEFDVTINKISEKILPELNDEFAKKFGIETYAEFEKIIHENIDKEHERQIKLALKAVVDKAIREKYCDFDVPAVFLEPEYKRLLELFTERNSKKTDKEKKSASAIEKEANEKARQNVCMSYIYREFITKEKLDASEEEINSEIATEAAMYGKPLEEAIVHYNQNPNAKNRIVSKIQEDKAFELILSKITTKEKKIKPQDLSNELSEIYKSID
jgi:trigger factor